VFSQDTRWKIIAENLDSKILLDQATMSGGMSAAVIWVKMIYKNGLKPRGGGLAFSSLSKININCKENTVSIQEERFYDRNEDEINRAFIGQRPPEQMAPGTMIELITKDVCQR